MLVLTASRSGSFVRMVSIMLVGILLIKSCTNISSILKRENLDSGEIRLEEVNYATMVLVVEYCKLDPDAKVSRKEKVDKIDQVQLMEIALAVNYLDINSLLDVTCREFAERLEGSSAEEARKIFNVPNDLTPEEEAKILKENAPFFNRTPLEEEEAKKILETLLTQASSESGVV